MATDAIGGAGNQAGLYRSSSDGTDEAQRTTKTLLRLIDDLTKFASLDDAPRPEVPPAPPAETVPSIDGVSLNFSPEDMAAALQVLRSKTQDSQIKVTQQGLDISKNKMAAQNERALAKIHEWIKASEEAAAKAKVSSTLDWVAKIGAFLGAVFAVIGAAVATAVTGGAAAPLLAVAIIGVVGAGMSLASTISQANGGPALDIGSLMNKAVSAILTAMGVPEDKVEAASKVITGAMAVLVPALLIADASLLGNFVGGIAQLAGANEMQSAIVSAVFAMLATVAVMGATMVLSGGTAAVEGTAKLVQLCAKIGQAVVGIASGVAGATAGGYNIAKAQDEHTAAVAQADRTAINAIIAKLGKQMEDDREELKKVIQELMDGFTVVSQMISAAADNRLQILQAGAGRGTAV